MGEKCGNTHIGRTHNLNICTDCEVDSWKDILTQNENGEEVLQDSFVGKESMKNVHEKKYLGDIITDDINKFPNIKDKTIKAMGIVNKISTTLIGRPYGKFFLKQPY